jgi:DNA-binding transcriptional ArsR family regulator
MEISAALNALTALSQETRLRAFRILLEHGREGIASGELSAKLGIPQNTLSFHLTQLRNAGLATSRKHSRSVIYYANIEAMEKLIAFLVEDCCSVNKSSCEGIDKILSKVTKKSCC